MLEVSRRARRMERHHKLRKQSPLNLVSLMDIFTILVFFLLVNSSSSHQLPSNKDLKLPTSTAKKVAEETLIIAITKTEILVQGHKVAELVDLLNNNADDIPALKEELLLLALLGSNANGDLAKTGGHITIMGDENISYDIVRKILATCQQANFTNIAFAATQVAAAPVTK